MEDKFKWHRSIWATIDWSPHGILLTRQTYYKQKFLVKVIHKSVKRSIQSITDNSVPMLAYRSRDLKTFYAL
eukprot:15366212-Ditylum_brightwellii.AAC.1